MRMITYADVFLIVTVFISAAALLYAYRRGGMDFSALVVSGLVGVLVIFLVGPAWLYIILGFFVSGNLVTRYRHRLKEKKGLLQETRTFRNVLGNGAAAIIFAFAYHFTGQPLMLVGFVGSMSAAAADTFATEVGAVHSRSPRLITTFERTVSGTSGAISAAGFLAALCGAAIISFIPFFFPAGFDNTVVFFICTLSGLAGCCVDSIIGASLEGRIPYMDNHTTNFIGTFFGGVCAVFLYWFIVF